MTPAGSSMRDRGVEQLALQRGEAGDVGRRLVPGDVRMAADRAGRGAGRIEQQARDRRRRAPVARIGDHDLGGELEPREVRAQPLGAPGRDLERDHPGAGGGELRGLAAGRGAEVEHAAAGDVGQQAGGQRGGGVLHPPGAVAIARQLLDRAARRAAQRAAVQRRGVEPARPDLGVLLDREIERRLGQMRLGDPARDAPRHRPRTTPATASPAC